MNNQVTNKSVLLILALLLFSTLAVVVINTDVKANPAIIKVPDDYGTIQAAVNAAASGETILVAAGTYNERVRITKPIILRGAQYEVDPTQPGARTDPASESVIDLTGLRLVNPNVLVDIVDGVSNVEVAGFTLIGSPVFHWADESVVRGGASDSNSNIVIKENIISGYYGVHLRRGASHIVQLNRIVVNKVGVTVQFAAPSIEISNNLISPGSSMANDPAGIYVTSTSGVIRGNTITGMIGPDKNGRGIHGSNNNNLEILKNTISGNGYDGIAFWGTTTHVTIAGNILTNNGVTRPGNGISIKGQDITITGNLISGNSYAGVYIDKHVLATERVLIKCNRIYDNTEYGVFVNTQLVTEPVDARYSWWGDPTGPNHPTSWTYMGSSYGPNPGLGDSVSDYVLYRPWKGLAKIDIKPGSYPNSINLKSKGVVPVALLGSGTFDVSTVDLPTVVFAGATPVRWAMQDINSDGYMDIVFHFNTESLQLTTVSTVAALAGMYTIDDSYLPFLGSDTVNIVSK